MSPGGGTFIQFDREERVSGGSGDPPLFFVLRSGHDKGGILSGRMDLKSLAVYRAHKAAIKAAAPSTTLAEAAGDALYDIPKAIPKPKPKRKRKRKP